MTDAQTLRDAAVQAYLLAEVRSDEETAADLGQAVYRYARAAGLTVNAAMLDVRSVAEGVIAEGAEPDPVTPAAARAVERLICDARTALEGDAPGGDVLEGVLERLENLVADLRGQPRPHDSRGSYLPERQP